MNNQFILSCLLVPLAIVVCSDLFYRKIRNRLIVLLLVIAMVNGALYCIGSGSYAALTPGQLQSELGFSLLGAAAVLLVGFGLFIIGQMGAGDVKLMAVLCLLVGSDNLLAFLLITALAGGVLAFMMPLVRIVEVQAAKRILQLSILLPALRIPVPDAAYTRPSTAGLPYGLAIAAGAVLSLITPLTH